MSKEVTPKEIIEARKKLWRMGNLEWKLESIQQDIRNLYLTSEKKTSVITVSRRLGKSYTLLCIASELCIRQPKAIVKFLLPEQKMARTIVRPLIEEIFKDAPLDLKPQFKTQDGIYLFKNGSEIQLAGTDNGNHEKLRGTDAHLCIVDEAGFVQGELDYIIKSILLPSTLITNGKIIISSTPPPDSNHDYVRYVQQAKIDGSYLVRTIMDAVADETNLRITPFILEEIANQYIGGVNNPDFQREFLCKFTVSGDQQVVPEFTEEVEEDIVTEWMRPPFYHSYTSMDIGFRDLTVALFSYYDYDNGVLVVEDELVMNGPEMTTSILAERIHEKERKLWTNRDTNEYTEPFDRVADNNLILINELSRDYGLFFRPAIKHNRDAAIATLRDRINARQIIINPRCKTLISHLKNATWDKSRKDFTRSADNGHYDAIPALYMLLRDDMIWSRNPYPPGFRKTVGQNGRGVFYRHEPGYYNQNDLLNTLSKQFKPKTSLRRGNNK